MLSLVKHVKFKHSIIMEHFPYVNYKNNFYSRHSIEIISWFQIIERAIELQFRQAARPLNVICFGYGQVNGLQQPYLL